ncbi:MAG TPA: putative metal-binding motif-containing protein [Myxococcota bacterium]|nr:putative metal-binding motif-containing protein [Myxococcota bacterium]
MNRTTYAPRARLAITSRMLALGLAALFAMAACSETEVVENLHLRISSEAPTGGGSLESLGILLVSGDTRYPATLGEPAFNPSLTGLDITSEPVLVSLQYDGQTFGDGDGVTLQVVGRTGQVVRTRFEGVVDLGQDKIIAVRLTNLPATCDGDGDGFLDCSNSACCPADSPFGDCDDGEIAANPWASAPACIPCGSTVDYDCDGQVEACVDADSDTVADCEETCGQGDPTVAPGLPEKCDGKDNDCDGSTDEGFELGGAQIGEACTAPGNCGAGVVECKTGDTTTCSSGPDGSESKVQDEVCDGGDNDCDGSTDEGFTYEGAAIGGACDGRGECGSGLVECAVFRTDLATCSTNPDGTEHSFATEVCNDLDDDCDGETDDGLTLADSDCKKVGVCATGAVATCDGGDWTCDYSNVVGYQDEETLCDGLDNDCDGQTDEGFLYEGAAIGEGCDGVGACGEGVVECEAGRTDRATCSTNPGGSDFLADGELCDGLDNDCDGDVDEGFSYLGADIGEACDGVGLCGAGSVVCAVGRTDLATCSTNPNGPASQAAEETCDNQDNDCDGNVDDELGLADSPCTIVGVCAAALGQIVATCSSGVWSCDYTNVPEYQADETRCDGRDNDCDGTTDEGFSYEGDAIGESCDGVGACGAGVVQCAVGREDLATCSTNPDGAASQVQSESCDDLDNDCDGQTDEAFLYEGVPVGQACDGVGECGAGVVECLTSTTATCSTNPNGSDPDTSPEACNTLDDDCDGQTDEGLVLADSTCTQVGVCAAALGSIVATCTEAGTWTCDYSAVPNHQAVEAACDQLDNDCDGQTDEPFKAGGTVTYTDPLFASDANLVLGAACGTGLCAGGVVICNVDDPNTMVCDRVAQNRRTEVCDDLDDDCDGQTDETFTALASAILPADLGKPKGESCGTGACGGGSVECNEAGTALECDSEVNASIENCDGDDDDCDGNTDEGFENSDGDEFADCVDTCIDADFDTICTNEALPLCVGGVNTGCRDNCPALGNADQLDADRDGKGDVCDTACPNGPGPFEVCGDCLDNDCSSTADEAGCAERRVITIAARDEALPAGYPVKLVLDHKTLVDAGWSTTSGDDIRIFYRDPTLPCDDTDPFSCSVELDRIADPLTPFYGHETGIWFALQAPLPANTATTQYELYYNVSSMFEPLEDETAIFHMADLFERDDSNTLGQGWVENNQAASDFAIAGGELNVNYNDDDPFTPIVTKGFDPISAASEIGRFELRLGYDWIRSGENSWAVLMQVVELRGDARPGRPLAQRRRRGQPRPRRRRRDGRPVGQHARVRGQRHQLGHDLHLARDRHDDDRALCDHRPSRHAGLAGHDRPAGGGGHADPIHDRPDRARHAALRAQRGVQRLQLEGVATRPAAAGRRPRRRAQRLPRHRGAARDGRGVLHARDRDDEVSDERPGGRPDQQQHARHRLGDGYRPQPRPGGRQPGLHRAALALGRALLGARQ